MSVASVVRDYFIRSTHFFAEQISCIQPLEKRTLLSAWITSDDFQLAPNQSADVYYGGMAADAAGNVYAAGEAYDSAGVEHDLVRMKPAGGTSWITISDQTSPLLYRDVAVNPAGDLYVCGSGGGLGWTVMRMRRSVGENTFTVIDQPTFPSSSNAGCLAIDSAGSVYAVGNAMMPGSRPNQSYVQWVVRKQTGGEGAFATREVFNYFGSVASASDVTVIPTGPAAGVYVVGNANTHWLARRSADGGQTWSTVDDFQYTPTTGGSNWAYGVAGDATGNVYVVGRAVARVQTGGTARKPVYTSSDYWMTRKGVAGTSGAMSWSVDDAYRHPLGYSHQANAVAITSGGDVFVVGFAYVGGNGGRSIVRSNVGAAWTTADDYVFPAGNYGEANHVVIDAADHVFVGGGGFADGSDIGHWIVRSNFGGAATASGPATFGLRPLSSNETQEDVVLFQTALCDELL